MVFKIVGSQWQKHLYGFGSTKLSLNRKWCERFIARKDRMNCVVRMQRSGPLLCRSIKLTFKDNSDVARQNTEPWGLVEGLADWFGLIAVPVIHLDNHQPLSTSDCRRHHLVLQRWSASIDGQNFKHYQHHFWQSLTSLSKHYPKPSFRLTKHCCSYCINQYTVALIFPWCFSCDSWLSSEAVPDLLQWIKPNCQKQFAKWAFWPAIMHRQKPHLEVWKSTCHVWSVYLAIF